MKTLAQSITMVAACAATALLSPAIGHAQTVGTTAPGGPPPARAWGTPIPPAMVPAMVKRIADRAEQGPHSRFDPKTSALVLVEFQRDWLDPRGTLRQVVQEPDAMDQAAKTAERALAAARQSGMRVIHVGISFAPGYSELGPAWYGVRGIQPMMQPFRSDTPGVEWMPPFEPKAGEFAPTGRTGMSAFAGSNLDNFLRNNGITTLYVAGFATEVCFESTIREGHDRGYHMIALTDATASFTRAAREASLKTGVHHFAFKMDTDRFVQTVSRPAVAQR
jgi:nicotinamidase-related amidase